MSKLNIVRRISDMFSEGRFLLSVKMRLKPFLPLEFETWLDQPVMHAPVLTIRGDSSSNLASQLEKAFLRGCMGDSKLPQAIREIPGMSGQKYRSTINNLIEQLDDARYLEVGSWAGSTAASAVFGNAATCLCVDDWSEFGGPKAEFETHMKMARGENCKFEFIEEDFRKVDFAAIGKFNVYLFDGPHEFRDHFDGITMAQDALDDEHILIVDDWNWQLVRAGTYKALEALGSEIVFQIDVRSTIEGGHPKIAGEHSDWHNGYFMGVVRKKPHGGSRPSVDPAKP